MSEKLRALIAAKLADAEQADALDGTSAMTIALWQALERERADDPVVSPDGESS
jgi:hypothetical protein